MMRYLRLYARFVEFSFSRALQFRLDFFFRIAMDLIYYVFNLLFFEVIYLHAGQFAGWNSAQARVFVGLYILIDALQMTLFSNNTWMLPGLVNKGDLDYYLLRPVSSLFFVSLRDFAANSFVNLLMAATILGWALLSGPVGLTPVTLGLCGLYLAIGLLLHYSLHMIFVLAVFWTQSGQGFAFLHWTFTRFTERPDRIYTGVLRVLVTTVLPYGIIASFPARLVLEGFHWPVFLKLAGLAIGFFGIVLWMWNRGLKIYASASS